MYWWSPIHERANQSRCSHWQYSWWSKTLDIVSGTLFLTVVDCMWLWLGYGLKEKTACECFNLTGPEYLSQKLKLKAYKTHSLRSTHLRQALKTNPDILTNMVGSMPQNQTSAQMKKQIKSMTLWLTYYELWIWIIRMILCDQGFMTSHPIITVNRSFINYSYLDSLTADSITAHTWV